MADNPLNDEPKSEYYPSYAEFSKTLRTWFVAYGIGGPVVLVGNERAWKAIVASGLSIHIGLLFLMGGGLQVVSAFLNKHAMWHMYIAEPAPSDTAKDAARRQALKEKCPYRIAYWYSEQNWIDELLDFYTLLAFAWATALAFEVLSAQASTAVVCDHGRSVWAWLIGAMAAMLLFALRLITALRNN